MAAPSLLLLVLLIIVEAGCDTAPGSDSGKEVLPPEVEPASLERTADHRSWGWETLVLRNGFLQLAAVPSIGGRIMEFSLDGEESMWVNASQLGNEPSPSPAIWPNHGGYKNWPAPQARWNWPPPPVLDYGRYEDDVVWESADSVVISLTSDVEQYRAPGLRFARTITVYAGSSRARIAQTIENVSAEDANWSVWDITQNLVQHAPARDFDNFRVYFPINPDSRYGATGVRTDRASDAWAGAVSDSVYEVRFRPDNAKLFADSRGGWICYADLRDGYAYVKTFPVFHDGTYPDQGADVEVYVSNQNYVEVEVLSPIVSLPAGGGSYTFTEDWWAARTDGPVLDVNEAGIVNAPLQIESATGRTSGRFGVFHVGLAYVVVYGDAGELTRTPAMLSHPTEMLHVDAELEIPEAATRVELVIEASDGGRRFVLSAVDL